MLAASFDGRFRHGKANEATKLFRLTGDYVWAGTDEVRENHDDRYRPLRAVPAPNRLAA